MKFDDFIIEDIDYNALEDTREWQLSVKKTFPSKTKAKKYLHSMLKQDIKKKSDDWKFKRYYERKPFPKKTFMIQQCADDEYCLRVIRELIDDGFRIENDYGDIVAEGHAKLVIPKDNKNVFILIGGK